MSPNPAGWASLALSKWIRQLLPSSDFSFIYSLSSVLILHRNVKDKTSQERYTVCAARTKTCWFCCCSCFLYCYLLDMSWAASPRPKPKALSPRPKPKALSPRPKAQSPKPEASSPRLQALFWYCAFLVNMFLLLHFSFSFLPTRSMLRVSFSPVPEFVSLIARIELFRAPVPPGNRYNCYCYYSKGS